MKTALILGAKSDIARALAVELAVAGVDLVLAARSSSELSSFRDELCNKYNIKASLLEFDALNYTAHPAFCNQIPRDTDAAFCVFGYLGDQKKAEQNQEEMLRIINTNYEGAVSILDLIADRFEKNNHGLIVGISSVAGDRPRRSNYFYGSSKASFTAYLHGLRDRMQKYNVKVLTVKPGYVDTAMTKHLKLPPVITASPEQAARAIMRAIQKGCNEIYVPGVWRYNMWVIKLIPEFIFKRMNL